MCGKYRNLSSVSANHCKPPSEMNDPFIGGRLMISIRSTKAGTANPKEYTSHDLPCWTSVCFCMFEEPREQGRNGSGTMASRSRGVGRECHVKRRVSPKLISEALDLIDRDRAFGSQLLLALRLHSLFPHTPPLSIPRGRPIHVHIFVYSARPICFPTLA